MLKITWMEKKEIFTEIAIERSLMKATKTALLWTHNMEGRPIERLAETGLGSKWMMKN